MIFDPTWSTLHNSKDANVILIETCLTFAFEERIYIRREGWARGFL